MNYVTGKTIRELREQKQMTQKELAEKINVSDKTVSKWETDRGLPDISIIEDLCTALEISVPELLTGEIRQNKNKAGNMRKTHLYVCPVCGNIIAAVGQGSFSCCGITLPELEAEMCDEEHQIQVSIIDNEYFVTMNHPMSKNHYISFLAYITSDGIEIIRMYPEQDIAVRFRRKGHGTVLAYCNRHSIYRVKV